MSKILEEVSVERQRQDAKWGEQNHDDLFWLGVLLEEAGEVSRAIIQTIEERDVAGSVRKELIETAAVVVAWLEAMERRTSSESGA